MVRPLGLQIHNTPDARVVRVHPYMSTFGKREIFVATLTVWAALFLMGSGPLSVALAALVLCLGGGLVIGRGVLDARRVATWVELYVSKRRLAVVWRRKGRVLERVQMDLVNIGRVEVVSAGYERSHLVLHGVGETLVIPMEREMAEGVQWVAEYLEAVSEKARRRAPP